MKSTSISIKYTSEFRPDQSLELMASVVQKRVQKRGK